MHTDIQTYSDLGDGLLWFLPPLFILGLRFAEFWDPWFACPFQVSSTAGLGFWENDAGQNGLIFHYSFMAILGITLAVGFTLAMNSGN